MGGHRNSHRRLNDLGNAHLSTGSHCSVDGQLSLGQKVLKVAERAHAQRVLEVQALHRGEVASHLGGALAKPHQAVVKKRSSVAVRGQRVGKAWWREGGREEEG